MSKKITSLLVLMMMFFSTSAFAQLDELAKKSVSVGGAVATMEPNTWYFLHQSRVLNADKGTHSEVGELPMTGGFMYDCGIGEDLLKSSLDDVPDGSSASEKAAYIVRFVPSEDNEGAYRIQFGTGNWLQSPANITANSQKFTTTDSEFDAGEYNVYNISVEGEIQEGHFGLNIWDMNGRFDNNGVGYTIVTWNTGEITSIDGNSDWAIHEVVFDELNEYDVALTKLTQIVNDYRGYRDTFVAGTDPGMYGQAEVDAFGAALDAADFDNPDNNPDSWTVEDMEKMGQAIIDAYEAVLASKVPMTVADGYYRIRTAMTYSKTETITNEETLEEETITTEYPKYMGAAISNNTIYGGWYTPDDMSSDCPSLWSIKNKDGYFDIVNVAFDARFTAVRQSANVVLSTESDSLMAIDPVVTIDGITYFDIRCAAQEAGKYLYLHQGGHGGGSGESGNLVGWSSGFNASEMTFSATEWFLEPVSEEEAQAIIKAYAPIKDRELMLDEYDSIMTHAKDYLEIARDIQTNVFDEEGKELITANEQFSSPYTEPSEGSIEALLDGDASTFWHSNWSDGSCDGGIHYLQVEMPDEEVSAVAARFTRRPVQNDHVTEFGIFGTNEFEAEKEACEELAVISTPFKSNTETITTNAFETKGYKYIRFYANTTTNNRGYWHVSEFQLYPAEITQSETAQCFVMGDLFTNLETVVNEQAELETDDIDVEAYTKLKAAYDAFIAKFVDPTALRDKLEEVKDVASSIIIGTNPGYWNDDSTGKTLNNTITEAKAYDTAGDYTPEKSEKYIEDLTNQAANVLTAANGIKTGKWYRFRFGTVEEYETYGWDLVAGQGSHNEDLGIDINEDLWGKYITATVNDAETYEDENLNEHTYYTVREGVSPDDLGLGCNLYLDADEDIAAKDLSLFRFIAVGDSTYILQNKGTNLFIRANDAKTGNVTLSAQPTLFNQRAVGYGVNVIAGKNYVGETRNYLHCQVNNNVIVTWNAYYPGSRSALYIEEAEDVAGDYVGAEFNVPVVAGAVNTFCFPVEISVEAGQMWGVNSVVDGTVTLAKIDKAEAGRPFIYINGETSDYDPEFPDETEMVVFKHGYDIAAEPNTDGLLKGTYTNETIGRGKIVATANKLEVSKASSTAVSHNQAYIAGEEDFDPTTEVVVVFSDEADGIATALATVSKSGAVYTVDGRLVSKKATLNDLQKFGKGMYILNGVKVLVK